VLWFLNDHTREYYTLSPLARSLAYVTPDTVSRKRGCRAYAQNNSITFFKFNQWSTK